MSAVYDKANGPPQVGMLTQRDGQWFVITAVNRIWSRYDPNKKDQETRCVGYQLGLSKCNVLEAGQR